MCPQIREGMEVRGCFRNWKSWGPSSSTEVSADNGYFIFQWLPWSCLFTCFKMLMFVMSETTFLLEKKKKKKQERLPAAHWDLCLHRYSLTIWTRFRWPQMECLGHTALTIHDFTEFVSKTNNSFLLIPSTTLRSICVPVSPDLKRVYLRSQAFPRRCVCLPFFAHKAQHGCIKGQD